MGMDGIEMLVAQQAAQRPPLSGQQARHQQQAPAALAQAGQDAAVVGQLLQGFGGIAKPLHR